MINKKVKAKKEEYRDFDKWVLDQMGELTQKDLKDISSIKKSVARKKLK